MLQRAWIPTSIVAVALAGLVVWRSFDAETPAAASHETAAAGQSVAALSETLGLTPTESPLGVPERSTETQLVDFDPLEDSGAVYAEAVDVPRPVPLPRTAEHATPAALPRQNSAQPIDVTTAAADRELDELIARELAELPEQQRSVWRDVLQGLSAEEAGEILQIWKLTGRINRSPPTPTWPGLIPSDASPTAEATDDPTAKPPVPAEAAAVLHENLQHLNTPGFVRGNPSRPPLLDLTPGDFRETTNPLHLAVNSGRFFVVRRGDRLAFTRNGEFDLDEHRQLVLQRRDGEWRLEPPVELPADAARVDILRDGTVRVMTASAPEKWTEVGRIPVATFLNPQHLQRLDGDLLQPTKASGEPVVLSHHQDIWQGRSQSSNATLEREAAAIRQWEERDSLLEKLSR